MTTATGRTAALLASVLLYCCQPAQHSYQPPQTETAPPKMVFMTFSIHNDSTGKSELKLLSKKEADGKIKGKSPAVTSPTNLTISLLDGRGKVLVEEVIEHPLYREVEYTNDKNEFERKALNLKDAEFFVRINLPLTADRALVTEVIDQKKVNSVEFNIK